MENKYWAMPVPAYSACPNFSENPYLRESKALEQPSRTQNQVPQQQVQINYILLAPTGDLDL